MENKEFATLGADKIQDKKTYEDKLREHYGDMLVYKSSGNSKFFSALSIPSFMRDWLVMRFSDKDGVINKKEADILKLARII